MAITKATASSVAPAAKGDLVVGSGTNDAAVLAVGTNNYVLTADSAETTGLKWAAAAGGGKVLQVVGATTSTATTSTTSTPVDTTLTATITPTASNSKVLVLISQNGVGRNAAGNAQSGTFVKLLRGATDLMTLNGHYGYTNTLLVFFGGSVTANYLDSPNTTSSTTYKTQFNAPGTSSTGYVQEGGATSTITLIEIGA